MSENLKWVVTCLIVFVIAFSMGYLSGLSIPERAEFGLDQKTIDALDRFANASCEAKCIDYNQPFRNATYGIGGIQR